jgi:hypothetical protein
MSRSGVEEIVGWADDNVNDLIRLYHFGWRRGYPDACMLTYY